MDDFRFALFETRLGDYAIVISPNGVCGAQLPERDRAAAIARIHRRWPQAREAAPDHGMALAMSQVTALLSGKPHDFSGVALDLDACSAFNRSVYALTSAIPAGETRTYGEIARSLGDVALSRAVGRALGENPIPIIIPCHRVLAADGRTGGFSAPGGLDTKFALLNIELAYAKPAPGLFGDEPLPLARKGERPG